MTIEEKIEPWKVPDTIDSKGWNINFSQLLARYYNYNSSAYNLTESKDKKYCCLFYNIIESRMSWYTGQIAIFENKLNPILITNPTKISFDYSSFHPVIFDENILFLRKSAYNQDDKLSGYPFVIMNLYERTFGFLDFNLTSLYYSPKRVNTNLFKLTLDYPEGLNLWKAESRHEETFDLANLTFYPLTLIDNCLELYWKEKSMSL